MVTEQLKYTFSKETNMNRRLKFIWDFKGPDAEKIAAHHCIHLTEYLESKQVNLRIVGQEIINKNHHVAFMVVEETNMKQHRDALKPHRGQVCKE